MTLDEMRRATEALPGYDKLSYYEKLAAASAAIALERGTLQRTDLDVELGEGAEAPTKDNVRYACAVCAAVTVDLSARALLALSMLPCSPNHGAAWSSSNMELLLLPRCFPLCCCCCCCFATAFPQVIAYAFALRMRPSAGGNHICARQATSLAGWVVHCCAQKRFLPLRVVGNGFVILERLLLLLSLLLLLWLAGGRCRAAVHRLFP